jgi:hypothetical protein
MLREFAVIEGSGTDQERIIKRFKTYDKALSFFEHYYSPEEILDLYVDIVGIDETTEI